MCVCEQKQLIVEVCIVSSFSPTQWTPLLHPKHLLNNCNNIHPSIHKHMFQYISSTWETTDLDITST